MNGMPSPLNLPTYYPKHIPTHISSFMKKNWPAQTRTKTEPHFTSLLMVKVALDRRGLVWAAEG